MNQVVNLNAGYTAAWTSRQLDTIKRTVAKDTNDDEFNLFIEYAKVKHLDPFSKQVVAIVFNKDKADKRQMSIVTTQDGLRVLAARCGDYHPAKPNDTEYALTEYESERQRLLAEAAKIFNKADRTARLLDINANMAPDPTNPAGIVLCRTKLYKGGEPVAGEAYWTEFAPLRPNPAIYEWVETGEVYEDSGKPKKRRQVKAGLNPTDNMVLDDSGQWFKMARVMVGKCATMQGLRAGWPAVFGGVYAEEEFDRARTADLTATEMVEQEREQRRMKAIAMTDDEYPFVGQDGNLTFISNGRYGDHILMLAHNCSDVAELDGMKSRNREGLQRFWAKHKDDALSVSQEMEKIRAGLTKKVQQQ